MNELVWYDGESVRITDVDGEVFEGVCLYADEEYSEVLYERGEECLMIANFLFYAEDIKEITVLEDEGGPYGPFSGPWGKIELINAFDGARRIEDELYYEREANALRMLRLLEHLFEKGSEYKARTKSEVAGVLGEVLDYDEMSDACRRKVESLLEKLTGQ